jgi:hypothetical protein
LLTGLRIDAVFSQKFAAYLSLGTTTKNNMTFYAQEKNLDNPNLPYKVYFYDRKLKPIGFFNFGMVYRFGKTKSFYNDKNMYDVMDLNSTNAVGDESTGPNTDIPFRKSLKRSKLNIADIQDLIDINDN